MDRPSRFFLLAFVGPLVALAAWLMYRETRVPQDERETLNRMIELQEEGRYDKAAQVVQNWMNNSRRDASHDEFLYGQIAIVWIKKAYARRGSRSESIGKAEENLQKELSLYEGQSHNDLSLDPFEMGRGYEVLADISDKDQCRLYEKSHELLARQLTFIKGDSYTSYGDTIPLEPVRRDVQKHRDTVNDKLTKVGCQPHPEQPQR